MLDEAEKAAVSATRKVCLALVAGVVTFGVVVAVIALTGTIRAPAEALRGVLVPLAGIFALASLASAPFLESVLRKLPAGAERSDSVARYTHATIVGFAVREAAALFALVVALVTGELPWTLGITALVLYGMLAALPSEEKLRRHLVRTG